MHLPHSVAQVCHCSVPPRCAATAATTTALGQVVSACEQAPSVVVGKPSLDLARLVLATHGLDPQRTCMVGDRLDTDVLFGRRGEMHTMLVLSGVATRAQAEAIVDEGAPHRIADSIAALLPLL